MSGTIPLVEWEALGFQRFGPDKAAWTFVCPNCGTEASIEKAREVWPELRGKGWDIATECVGRYLDGSKAPRMTHDRRRRCDWAAYGLFRGPVFVKTEQGVSPCFAFAEAKARGDGA